MKKWLILLVCCMFFQSANATATIEIPNYSAKEFKEMLVKYYIKQGLGINVINDYSFVATKVYNSYLGVAMSSAIYGSKSNMYPELRYNYNFVQNGDNVLVQLTMVQVNDAGTASQNSIYLKPAQEIKTLNTIKANIVGYYSFGFSVICKKKYWKIVNVDKSVTSELENGYLLIEIEGKPVSNINNAEFQQIFGASTLKTVNCKIQKDKNTEPYIVNITNKFIKPIGN